MNNYVYSFAVEPDELLSQVLLLLAMAVLTTILEAPFVLIGFRKSEYKHKVLLLILVNSLTISFLKSLRKVHLRSVNVERFGSVDSLFRNDLGGSVLGKICENDPNPGFSRIQRIDKNSFSFIIKRLNFYIISRRNQ